MQSTKQQQGKSPASDALAAARSLVQSLSSHSARRVEPHQEEPVNQQQQEDLSSAEVEEIRQTAKVGHLIHGGVRKTAF